MSGTKIGIFWPGDYRSKPNELARPNAEEATVQLERALKNSAARAIGSKVFSRDPTKPSRSSARWMTL